ncbi:MAG: alpha amylase C-terminal domain-containing protein [Thermoflexibacter sp.]
MYFCLVDIQEINNQVLMKLHARYLPMTKNDAWLVPYNQEITRRFLHVHNMIFEIENLYGSLYDFAGNHLFLGLNYDKEAEGWYYREWAPAAKALFLIGDFNEWNRISHPLKRRKDGIWEIFLDDKTYSEKFTHKSKFKVLVHSQAGELERIPPYIRRVIQDETTKDFSAQLWNPKEVFDWEGDEANQSKILDEVKDNLLIYECHVGMAQEKEGIGTYLEFAENILPRIKDLGYNAIQMMAIHEHPYYGSFGYHVSSFFAPSSRFGTPEDLKLLIKKAHELGIAVIMDIVHSHAVKNIYEGLNFFDGTEYQYFHAGGKGNHDGWDSKLFDYGKKEVLQFLLSNVRYWLEEFHFDGFRFDGVTSMLYHHHGLGASFVNLSQYFDMSVDTDALTYLQLANALIHNLDERYISIAEDMSGMPGTCRPILEGGLGFDYRLGMGIPDYWIKLLKEYPDETWNIHDMWHVLTNRRFNEKTIAYSESHDQALVGDKTIAFWLMDKEMYYSMSKDIPNLAVDRGIALHKLIRLFTMSLGGDAYLNFMGNEFGHPEWIDFPREGNGWSYKYARRQWSLVDNKLLRYEYLKHFDKAMIKLSTDYQLLKNIPSRNPARQLNMDEVNKIVIFERAGLIFVFNFHTTHSIPDYKFWVPQAGKYKIVLNSDDEQFGGFNRIKPEVEYFTLPEETESGTENFLQIYIPNRVALVFRRVG